MSTPLINLDHLRIPGQPDVKLEIDQKPLQILNTSNFTQDSDSSNLTPAIGLATILYNWCPDALYAFLDISTWLSVTWTLKLESSQIEISRIRNQITFGLLDNNGHYKIMLTYHLTPKWIPDPDESMLGDRNIEDPKKIESMARSFVRDLILKKRWETGKGMKHEFYVDFEGSGCDAFEDGIQMSPHWVYKALNLEKCTTCGVNGKELRRCGRCGTAAYCSDECQKNDWAVHKAVCGMSMEVRGKALHLSKDGGLVGLVRGRQGLEEATGGDPSAE